jgi:hypothetical protein
MAHSKDAFDIASGLRLRCDKLSCGLIDEETANFFFALGVHHQIELVCKKQESL